MVDDNELMKLRGQRIPTPDPAARMRALKASVAAFEGQVGQACSTSDPCVTTLFCNTGGQPSGTCAARATSARPAAHYLPGSRQSSGYGCSSCMEHFTRASQEDGWLA